MEKWQEDHGFNKEKFQMHGVDLLSRMLNGKGFAISSLTY